MQAGEAAVLGEAFDGDDGAPRRAGGGGEAGADGLAVEEDGAGAAVAGVAADLGAGEAGVLAQELREAAGRGGVEDGGAAVQGEAEGGAVEVHASAPTARRRSSAAASAR